MKNKIKEQEIIALKVFGALKECCDELDPKGRHPEMMDYIAYVMFCSLGGGILHSVGKQTFNDYVKQIKDKALK